MVDAVLQPWVRQVQVVAVLLEESVTAEQEEEVADVMPCPQLRVTNEADPLRIVLVHEFTDCPQLVGCIDCEETLNGSLQKAWEPLLQT